MSSCLFKVTRGCKTNFKNETQNYTDLLGNGMFLNVVDGMASNRSDCSSAYSCCKISMMSYCPCKTILMLVINF